MIDQSGPLIVAMVAIGMGLSFLAADPKTPTSRFLAAALGSFGLTVVTYALEGLGAVPGQPLLWPRLHSVFEGLALASGFEWILRVGRTRPSADCESRAGEGLLRIAQVLAAVYIVMGLVFPAERAAYLDRGFDPGIFFEPMYYPLMIPFWVSIAFSSVRLHQLLRSDLDQAERIRLVAFAVATPFFAAPLIVPTQQGPFIAVTGELIFLAGAIRYHVMQGQRGQFLARFLSPQVARLVSERGLSTTMQQNRVQLSVVACDLRAFTAFAETAAPEEVLQFLRDYYEAIGEAVTEYGGTIKDFAGDGILTLVGAPIVYDDHARRAVSMAIRIRERGGEVLERWRKLGLDLGLGIGVASGFVTVGTIGGAGRLEYAAIGPAVNLAARLCDRAESGAVLVDQRTVGLVGDGPRGFPFETLDPVELKGFSRPVAIFAIGEAAEPEPAPALTPAPAVA
jgi:class 3 adenylate cyclase